MEQKNFTTETDRPFHYMLLDRLRVDCHYFLDNEGGCEKHLWAGSVDGQIAKMKELWHGFTEKPLWISLEEIERLEQQMKQRLEYKSCNTSEKSYCS